MPGKIKWQKMRIANRGLRNWSALQFESSPAGHKNLTLAGGTRSHSAIRIPHFLSVCLGPSFCRRVLFRQGLWITDLQTPPWQEWINGSMLCVALVLSRLAIRHSWAVYRRLNNGIPD